MSKPSQTEKDIAAAMKPPKTKWTTKAGSRAASCSPRELREAFRAGCYRYRAGLGDDLPPTSQRDMNTILRWSHDAYPDPEENASRLASADPKTPNP